MNTINISKAALMLGVTVKTMQRWDRGGKLKPLRTETNRRAYTEEQLRQFRGIKQTNNSRVAIAYCRVSSNAQRPDLKNQRKVVEDFCLAKGFDNVEFVEEVGGGLNFKRKKFIEVIDRIIFGDVRKLIIAHKDRLARFGFPLLQHICMTRNCEVIVLNSEQQSPEQEMVQDLMTIVHCFSSRLYGLRNYRKSLKGVLKK